MCSLKNGSPDEAFELIAREHVTITAVVPPLAIVWMEEATVRRYDLTSLQVLQVGGAKLSAQAARRVRPSLGCQLQQVFGMAEGLVNYTRIGDSEELVLYTQGRPMSQAEEIRVVDADDQELAAGETGQLLTRGPYTIRGYYDAPEHNARAFTSDGFYRTGDLVRLLPSGHLIVEARTNDIINRGGDKVSAEEIENHLLAHPAILDVALVAMPDALFGERSCAFVIPRAVPGADALSLNRVKLFLRERGVAEFKLPDRLEVVDSFAQTSFREGEQEGIAGGHRSKVVEQPIGKSDLTAEKRST